MSRRSGQGGYVERKGNAFYVRFRIDVRGTREAGIQERPHLPSFWPRQNDEARAGTASEANHCREWG